jgi:hypothetical protein
MFLCLHLCSTYIQKQLPRGVVPLFHSCFVNFLCSLSPAPPKLMCSQVLSDTVGSQLTQTDSPCTSQVELYGGRINFLLSKWYLLNSKQMIWEDSVVILVLPLNIPWSHSGTTQLQWNLIPAPDDWRVMCFFWESNKE